MSAAEETMTDVDVEVHPDAGQPDTPADVETSPESGEAPKTPRVDRRRTLGRLGDWLRMDRRRIVFVAIVLVFVSGGMSAITVLIGQATQVVFRGAIGAQYEPGTSREEIIAQAEADGNEQLADLLRGTDFVPGEGIDFGALIPIVITFVSLTLLFAFLNWFGSGQYWRILVDAMVRLRAQIAEKIHRLTLAGVDRAPRGDLLSRMVNDVDNATNSLFQSGNMFFAAVSLVAMLVVMLVLSPLLTLVILVAAPLVVLVVVLIGRRSKKLYAKRWERTGQLNAQIEEAYSGHSLVAAFGRGREVGEKFRETNDDVYRTAVRADALAVGIGPFVGLVGNLVYVSAAVVGALLVSGAELPFGAVQGFIFAATFFLNSLTQLAGIIPTAQSGIASLERIFGLLDMEEDIADPDPAPSFVPGPGRVEFEHVSFRYEPETPLIEDLSFVAEPGHTIAIVGPTGAGKTTLVNLLLRFYELDGGRITLDGVDISTMARGDLRSRIGMVLQDTWLFDGTIRDNIGYGRPDATEEEILAAARDAQVDRFVLSLPDGFDTKVGEEDETLSAGEKQLITIARAFLAHPTVLVLDEATSSVDTRTELHIQRAMSELRRSRTCFVIAHRLSTIRDADRILVIEKGAIVEQGTHDHLVAAGGAYARLYQAQFAAPADDPLGAPA